MESLGNLQLPWEIDGSVHITWPLRRTSVRNNNGYQETAVVYFAMHVSTTCSVELGLAVLVKLCHCLMGGVPCLETIDRMVCDPL